MGLILKKIPHFLVDSEDLEPIATTDGGGSGISSVQRDQTHQWR